MNPNIFREYDVRGLIREDLTPQTVEALGHALGSEIAEQGGSRVGVGYDVRESSPILQKYLVAGLMKAGMQVERLGLVPTPAVYYAAWTRDLDGAVQITGSHNPIEYNGFKMMTGKESLYGKAIQALRDRIETGRMHDGEGSVSDNPVEDAYLADMQSRLNMERPLKVVLDTGNGCAGKIAPALMRHMGCEVEVLFEEFDGTFPHHIPDPTLPETLVALRERVLSTGADLGMAFDGDADRLGALDHRGRIIWGDQLLALFAREVLAKAPGEKVLFEVKCSRALAEDIEAHGGKPIMVRTGHSLIKAAMKEHQSPLAGEMSGHLFFGDEWFGFDDGIYAAGRLARLIAASSGSLAELVDSLPVYVATPEIRIDCDDDKKFAVVQEILNQYRETHKVVEVDGARIEFESGWGLVRASNTQPVLVMRAEGETEEVRDEILAELTGALEQHGVKTPGF